MKKNDDGTYTVQIAQAGVWDARGTTCPPEEIAKALDRLKEKQPTIFGEAFLVNMERIEEQIAANLPPEEKARARALARTEYQRRYIQIDEREISHSVDLSTVRFEGDRVYANIKPAGTLGPALEKLLVAEPPKLAMRALVQYKEGNTTRTHGHVVSYLDIISFDLVNNP